jgi:hypothetical protein
MIWMRLSSAARTRLHRVTSGRSADGVDGGSDRGFMLVYVLLITTIVTALVGTTLATSGNEVIPAQQAAYNQAANAAALGGLQAFLAYADQQCRDANSTVTTCTLPQTDSGTVTIVDDTGYKATYHWTAKQGTDYFRVTSQGEIKRGGLTARKRLVADVAGGVATNPLDSGYVTQYETQAPDVTQALFPNRTISLSSAAIANAGLPNTGATSVNWQGAQAGTLAGTVNVCNSLFGGAAGRVNNPPPGAPSPYVDWSETGTVGSTNYTNFQPCQVSLGHSTQFLAPTDTSKGLGEVRSQDAFLISNSYPGASGPTIRQPVYTQYLYNPSTDGTCGASGQNYRTYNLICAGYSVDIGGTPATGSYIPTHVAQLPPWPTDAPTINSGGANGACWYTGPTRVKLNANGSATVTSPQTKSVVGNSSLACYGGSVPNSTTGLVGVTVTDMFAASHGVVYVQNNGSAPNPTPATHTNTGWGVVDTRSAISPTNSVFYSSIPGAGATSSAAYVATATDKPYTPSIPDNPSTQTDAAWTPQWTSDSSGTTCNTSTALTDLKFYRCYAASGSYDATAYVDLKTAIKNALSTSPGTYASVAGFNSLVNSKVAVANSSDANNAAPTAYTNASRRWQVNTVEDAAATDGCTPAAETTTSTTTSTIAAPLAGDGMFDNTNGAQTVTVKAKTQCCTSTVTLQVGTCNVLLVLGVCVNLGDYVWGNGTAALGGGKSVAQFKVTATVKTTTTTTSSTTATSAFPQAKDVSQYAAGMSTNGPGDLYVEGTPSKTLALVAQDDLIVTNTLKPTDTVNNAIEMIARNNVRIYHPVGCASSDSAAIAATTAGFCPNDITGLYSGILPAAARPDQQYTNLNADTVNAKPLTNLQINAAIFALGNATNSCAKPAGGGGFCGGEITTDNYNRADGLGTVTITGGMYMAHHGPLGQEWEVADSTSVTSRPYSGYQLTEQFQSLSAAITGIDPISKVIPLTTTSSSVWRIVSVSTADPVTS